MDFGFKLPKNSIPRVKPLNLRRTLPNKREMARQVNFTNKRIREPVPAKRRHEVYHRAKNKCEWSEGCKEKEILDIHHKDMNPENNRLSNLILLCPTHHRKWHQQYKRVDKKDLLGLVRTGQRVVRRDSLKKKKKSANNLLYPLKNYKFKI